MTVDLNDLYRGDLVRLDRRGNGTSFNNRTRVAHVESILTNSQGEVEIFIRMRDRELRKVRPDQITKVAEGNGQIPEPDPDVMHYRVNDETGKLEMTAGTRRDALEQAARRKHWRTAQLRRAQAGWAQQPPHPQVSRDQARATFFRRE